MTKFTTTANAITTMDKYDFIQYAASRYGVDESVAETMLDMFADTLHELVIAGKSITIDEIGEFKTIPLFPNGINHQGNVALASCAKRNMVSFTPSEQLTMDIA